MLKVVNKDKRIYVAGHKGMVGAAIVRRLLSQGYKNIVTRSHAELDLTIQSDVESFFSSEQIDEVYLAAARVGGIHANNAYPADFIYQNIMIEFNVIHQAWHNGINKLLYLGSSCIYPREANQPIRESALMTGPLEATNEPYAVAKIAGIKLCESYNRQFGTDYRSIMPTNLFGQGDNYHPENSHVIPGLIRKFHDGKKLGLEAVTIWGTGTVRREFLHVDDLADAAFHLMEIDSDNFKEHVTPMQSHVNIGSGKDMTILELASIIKTIVGFSGKIIFDKSRPDGTPRKLLDITKMQEMGWSPKVDFQQGLRNTYEDFLQHIRS